MVDGRLIILLLLLFKQVKESVGRYRWLPIHPCELSLTGGSMLGSTEYYLYVENNNSISDDNIELTLNGREFTIANSGNAGSDVIGQYYGYTINNKQKERMI